MKTKKYMVWAASYYESESQMFPSDNQKHGTFNAESEQDLKMQLKAKGLIVEDCRWEIQSNNAI